LTEAETEMKTEISEDDFANAKRVNCPAIVPKIVMQTGHAIVSSQKMAAWRAYGARPPA
jgi:hypothetical protein